MGLELTRSCGQFDLLEKGTHDAGRPSCPDGVVQGCQSTSIAFGLRGREAGVRPSNGSVGDCDDNALWGSYFATLECEVLDRRRIRSPAEVRRAIFDYIDGWYSPHRGHASLNHESPLS